MLADTTAAEWLGAISVVLCIAGVTALVTAIVMSRKGGEKIRSGDWLFIATCALLLACLAALWATG
jgi:NADH:ubiquinone oxidoreductase subunit 6 (subunit J)